MIREGELIFNNNSSLSMNLYLENYPLIPLSSEDYEVIKVEGRNGDLIINKGTFPDKNIKFTFTMHQKRKVIRFHNSRLTNKFGSL